MIPKYLYQYTQLDSLFKILENKTIRFTRLDLLNDPKEVDVVFNDESLDSTMVKESIYTSCFSDNANENVAMWHMYSNMKGVRIKIQSNIFGNFSGLEETLEGYMPTIKIDEIKFGDKSKIGELYGPTKVTYVNDYFETSKGAVGITKTIGKNEMEFDMLDINIHGLGTKKNNSWSYEKEWRYLLYPFIELHGNIDLFRKSMSYFAYNPDYPKYIDIGIKSDILEIMTAPEMSSEDKSKLHDFLDNNHINIPVVESTIKTRFSV